MSGFRSMRGRLGATLRAGSAVAVAVLFAAGLGGCAGVPEAPLPQPDRVDLEAFMGDWYVIGGILTPFEDGAHNAVESYRLVEQDADGAEVAVTFRFREDAFDGDIETFHPRGFVRPGTGNTVWGMQFVWPLRMDYRIVLHDEAEGLTVIGRRARDYVWIMARTPSIPEDRYAAILAMLADAGYDAGAIRRVPQRWPE